MTGVDGVDAVEAVDVANSQSWYCKRGHTYQ